MPSIVFANSFNDAIKKGDNVLLYLYTNECHYCKLVSPTFDKIARTNPNKYKYMKINANTREGHEIMNEFGVNYVPFVMIIKSKENKYSNIGVNCLLSFACTNSVVRRY